MKVVITGIAGDLGKKVAFLVADAGHEVIGIDVRGWDAAPEGVEVVRADIRKRPAEDVFRTRNPEAVIHMATVTHLTRHRSEERNRINLGGTRTIFDHCQTYGVEHVIFVGRHTYYGAASDSPLYHGENEPPLGVATYPELADLVAADLYAGGALWRVPEMVTTVLRVVYALGPTKFGTLADYFCGPRVPTVLGYDPLFQFLHEDDIAAAIHAALEARLRGVFNVAGPQPVPLSTLCEATGRVNVPLPEPLFKRMLGRFGFPYLPPGAVNHIKYPITVDASLFREKSGWAHRYDEVEAMEAFRWG